MTVVYAVREAAQYLKCLRSAVRLWNVEAGREKQGRMLPVYIRVQSFPSSFGRTFLSAPKACVSSR